MCHSTALWPEVKGLILSFSFFNKKINSAIFKFFKINLRNIVLFKVFFCFIIKCIAVYSILLKKTLPRISQTELIALRSGNTSIDREILCGSVTLPKKYNWKKIWPDNKLDDLIQKNKHALPYNKSIVEYAGKNLFFSFLIDEKYGGKKLSVNELSSVLTKISSIDPALGVVVMVPNSLGPAELLLKYGTETQKINIFQIWQMENLFRVLA